MDWVQAWDLVVDRTKSENGARQRMVGIVIAASVYHLWQERNKRIYDHHYTGSERLIDDINSSIRGAPAPSAFGSCVGINFRPFAKPNCFLGFVGLGLLALRSAGCGFGLALLSSRSVGFAWPLARWADGLWALDLLKVAAGASLSALLFFKPMFVGSSLDSMLPEFLWDVLLLSSRGLGFGCRFFFLLRAAGSFVCKPSGILFSFLLGPG
ncbi:hypothetical protein OIU85_007140 [Salix viminalis]|uniref:Reverse transcriptase zinc-binding domain-containing protein n=1 Tax=Salix viminalis TaxID=40686 RepID=A0A9Q0P853_SALVM|nr:hypothetical protein OIU85_007140 [Salix viminalis]